MQDITAVLSKVLSSNNNMEKDYKCVQHALQLSRPITDNMKGMIGAPRGNTKPNIINL